MADRYLWKKRPDGAVDVETANSKRASSVVNTQEEGIGKARELGPEAAIHLERVRMVGFGRDKWRRI